MRPSSSLGEPQKPGGVGWTWMASAPIALARSNDRCSPPDESTWAPITGTQRDYVLKRPVLEGALHLRGLDGRAPTHPTESCDSAGTPRKALKPASPPARARSRIYAMRSPTCSSAPWLRPPRPRLDELIPRHTTAMTAAPLL